MYLEQTFEIVWLGVNVVIELISSNCEAIVTCADSYIHFLHFSCIVHCVINELAHIDITVNCHIRINTHTNRKLKNKNSFKPCAFTC